jgi:hypothetical protein
VGRENETWKGRDGREEKKRMGGRSEVEGRRLEK